MRRDTSNPVVIDVEPQLTDSFFLSFFLVCCLSVLRLFSTTQLIYKAPIVIHCASGMRAGKAKEILEAQGYTNVLNAGGYSGLGYLQEAASKN